MNKTKTWLLFMQTQNPTKLMKLMQLSSRLWLKIIEIKI